MENKSRGHPSQSEKPVLLLEQEEKLRVNFSLNTLGSTFVIYLDQRIVKRDNAKEHVDSLNQPCPQKNGCLYTPVLAISPKNATATFKTGY